MKMSKFATLFAACALFTGSMLQAEGIKAKRYEGNYISYGHSIGWTSPLGDASLPASRSQTNIAQFSIDKDGVNGRINFLSYTLYTKDFPNGLTISTAQDPMIKGLPLILTHTNPDQGAGSAKILAFPFPTSVLTFDFVAKVNSDESVVDKLLLSATTVNNVTNFPSNNASFIIAERQ